jgi:hypothetical protein
MQINVQVTWQVKHSDIQAQLALNFDDEREYRFDLLAEPRDNQQNRFGTKPKALNARSIPLERLGVVCIGILIR